MPLYEYGCPACGSTTDVRHGFNEKPELRCERCGAVLQRRFSAAPIVFKGSGFYVTDSRAKGSKSESAEKSETTKSEKPAEKSETTSAPTEKKSEAAA